MKKKPLLAGCVVLAALIGLAWHAGKPFLDKALQKTSTGTARPGVIATVNGTPIFLRQLEAVSDMNAPTLPSAQIASLEELWADYARNLNRLIIQALVHQELEKQGLRVSPNDLRNMEDAVSSGYGVAAGDNFNFYIEETGIPPDLWREQLTARLELALWQRELARGIVVSEEEVETYLAAHPEAAQMPARVDYLMISGDKKAEMEAAARSGQRDASALQARGFDVWRFQRAETGVPDIWSKDLAALEPGKASSPRQDDSVWRYVLLLDRQPARTRTGVELYAHVEGLLTEKKLPAVFERWLAQAVTRADIRAVAKLLPGAIPKPTPRPETPLPVQTRGDDALGAAGEEDLL